MQINRIGQISLTVIFSVFSSNALCETASDQHLRTLTGLIEMEKLSVGPYDNFQASVLPDESAFVFVRKVGLTNQIYKQSARAADAVPLVTGSGNSQNPEVSPDGSDLAYISFENRSLGDICITKVSAFVPTCLGLTEGIVGSPFWIGNAEIGFLSKDLKTNITKIIARKVAGGGERELGSGYLWSPTVSRNSQYLVYSKSADGRAREIIVSELSGSRKGRVRLSLPGNPGFASVSEDSQFLYFSYYLSDTNGDQNIDGTDNSVIMRVSLADVFADKEIYPEQLTSLTSNCNFPKALKNWLYVNCAFEGSLDVFRLPLAGIIPIAWSKDQLFDAHRAARSYGDRLILLHSLQRRFASFSEKDFLLRLLSNHLYVEDYSAATFYSKRLYGLTKNELYRVVEVYCEAWALMGRSGDQIPSAGLRAQLTGLMNSLTKVQSERWLVDVVRLRLSAFLERKPQSSRDLLKIEWPLNEAGVGRFIYYHTLRDLLVGSKDLLSELLDLYSRLVDSKEFSDESKIFYAFEWMSDLQKKVPDVKTRIGFIEKFKDRIRDNNVKALLESEVLTLNLILAPAAARPELYGKLTKLAALHQSNYFLPKSMYVRSVLALSDAGEFQFLNFVANNWVRYTKRESAEYPNAIRQFKTAVLGQAYGAYTRKEFSLASSHFYGSLSVIDDLESHFGFIVSKNLAGERAVLKDRYDQLSKTGFAVESMKFVQATLELLDFQSESATAEKTLNRTIELIESMKDYVNDPSRRLLLGYCYLEKTFALSTPLEIDRDSFEKAHYHLMLAVDLARDNDRLLASAYQNLGVLHQLAQNHGLSVEFFTKQKKLGFLTDQDQIDWSFQIARSYFYLAQYNDATSVLLGIQDKLSGEEKNFLTERLAFYSLAKEDYQKALKYYETLASLAPFQKRADGYKLYLAYGVALHHAGRRNEAIVAFKKSIELGAGKEKATVDSKLNPIKSIQSRVHLIATGYLSQIENDSKSKRDYLDKYIVDLKLAEKNLENFGIRKDSVIKYRVISDLRLLEVTTAVEERVKLGREVADLLVDYVKETGQYLGTTIAESLCSLLAEFIVVGDKIDPKTLAPLTEIYEKYIRSVENQPYSDGLAFQRLRVDAYWFAWQSMSSSRVTSHPWYKHLSESDQDFSKDLNALLAGFTN